MYVHTGDLAGMVKIWDLRNFKCIQTFLADGESEASLDGGGGSTTGGLGPTVTIARDGVSGVAHVSISPTVSRLVCTTKKLNFYEKEIVPPKPVTHDLPITCACFNEVRSSHHAHTSGDIRWPCTHILCFCPVYTYHR